MKPIELQVRDNIKIELIKYMVVEGCTYYIKIDAEVWHKIFKTKESNKYETN